ncbi:MAG: hypothetical protein IID43_00390 [Planctomycetes bacterium]|nr:hypothetical protein [Planctomycetota bacterium]
MTLGLLVYYLLPLDFITDTSSLHDSFLRARWDLGVAQPTSAGWLAGHSGGPLCHIVVAQRLIGALWFSVLGYCLVLSRREAGQRRMAAVGSAIEHGWALAVVAHLMTLFVASRVFDVVALCQSFPAVLLGASCAVFTVGTADRAPWKRRTSVTVSTLLLCWLAVLQVLAMAMGSIGTQTWAAGSAYLQRPIPLPFEAMWHLPIRLAASTALSHCVTYGALAGTLALMLQRAGVRAPWLASGALATAVALAYHTAAYPAALAGMDFTAPILAGVSALVLAALHRTSGGFVFEVADHPAIP